MHKSLTTNISSALSIYGSKHGMWDQYDVLDSLFTDLYNYLSPKQEAKLAKDQGVTTLLEEYGDSNSKDCSLLAQITNALGNLGDLKSGGHQYDALFPIFETAYALLSKKNKENFEKSSEISEFLKENQEEEDTENAKD
jgi:hypothetical protein